MATRVDRISIGLGAKIPTGDYGNVSIEPLIYSITIDEADPRTPETIAAEYGARIRTTMMQIAAPIAQAKRYQTFNNPALRGLSPKERDALESQYGAVKFLEAIGTGLAVAGAPDFLALLLEVREALLQPEDMTRDDRLMWANRISQVVSGTSEVAPESVKSA